MMEAAFEKIQAYFQANGNKPFALSEIAQAVDLEMTTVAAALFRTHRRLFAVSKPKTSKVKLWCLADPSGEYVVVSGMVSCEFPGHLLKSVLNLAVQLEMTPEEVMVKAVAHGMPLLAAQTHAAQEQDPDTLARINTLLPGDGRNDADPKWEDKGAICHLPLSLAEGCKPNGCVLWCDA